MTAVPPAKSASLSLQLQTADVIAIITYSTACGDQLQNDLILRGVDMVCRFTLDQTPVFGQAGLPFPALVILDPEGHADKALEWLSRQSMSVPVLVLSDTFQEHHFLSFFDHGARDYLIKPVIPAYFISRVILALSEKNLNERLRQRDHFLKTMGVITSSGHVFTRQYWFDWLLLEIAQVDVMTNLPALSLLLVQAEGISQRLMYSAVFLDALHAYIAPLLIGACRGYDVVGELEPDLYGIIVPRTNVEGASFLAKRIVKRMQDNPFVCPTIPGVDTNAIRFRVGIADFRNGLHSDRLYNKALEAIRKAQIDGTDFASVT